MTVFHIKLIAIGTMIIDHIGLFFFPQILLFRLIGRLSFPLFAWLIANGAYHSSNIKIYLVRLLILALISQVPFLLAFQQIQQGFVGFNVVGTLFLGLLSIYSLKTITNKMISTLIVSLWVLVAIIIQTDYFGAGVLSIVIFYLSFNHKVRMLLLQLALFLVCYSLPAIFLVINGQPIQNVTLWLMQPLGLASLLFIYMYNHHEGPAVKRLIYLFYPLQYFVIWYILLIRQS